MDKRTEKLDALKAAFPLTIPIMTGFLFLGIAYGILMNAKGYGPLWSFLMSAIAFCGSMQFVGITLLTVAFNPIQAFLLALMVNARHLFYGISMLQKYRGIGKVKPFLIYVLCDETFSIVCHAEPPENINKTYFYFFVSFLDYSYWVIGSVLGGFIGNLVSFNTKGLDFVLTALFVVIFLDQWLEKKNRIASLTGLLCSTACLIIFGSSQFIIPSMLCIIVSLSLLKKTEWGKRACI